MHYRPSLIFYQIGLITSKSENTPLITKLYPYILPLSGPVRHPKIWILTRNWFIKVSKLGLLLGKLFYKHQLTCQQ